MSGYGLSEDPFCVIDCDMEKEGQELLGVRDLEKRK